MRLRLVFILIIVHLALTLLFKANTQDLKYYAKITGNEGNKDTDKDKDINLKDGEVIKGVGGRANTVTVKMSDGSLKKYTFGGFNNYRNGSSDSRKEVLKHYVNEISDWEHEQAKEEELKREIN